MSDNGEYPKKLFIATQGSAESVNVQVASNYLPSLLLAQKLLDMKIMELMMMSQAQAEASKLIVPGMIKRPI